MDAIAVAAAQVVVGVDTHRDTHVAAVIDHVGRTLDHRGFAASPAGYRQLLAWARGHGDVAVVGIEGAGSWGVGLTRALLAAGVTVVEVLRPERRERRLRGKSDPIDAEAAARAALTGPRPARPRRVTGAWRPSAR